MNTINDEFKKEVIDYTVSNYIKRAIDIIKDEKIVTSVTYKDICTFENIIEIAKLIQQEQISGRKAKLILEGSEYTVTFE